MVMYFQFLNQSVQVSLLPGNFSPYNHSISLPIHSIFLKDNLGGLEKS